MTTEQTFEYLKNESIKRHEAYLRTRRETNLEHLDQPDVLTAIINAYEAAKKANSSYREFIAIPPL